MEEHYSTAPQVIDPVETLSEVKWFPFSDRLYNCQYVYHITPHAIPPL